MKYELTDEELILALRALQEDVAARDEIIKQQNTVIEKMRDGLEKILSLETVEFKNKNNDPREWKTVHDLVEETARQTLKEVE